MKALLVYPTHDNGDEVQSTYLANGIFAACYPAPRGYRYQRAGTELLERGRRREASDFRSSSRSVPHAYDRDRCLANGLSWPIGGR